MKYNYVILTLIITILLINLSTTLANPLIEKGTVLKYKISKCSLIKALYIFTNLTEYAKFMEEHGWKVRIIYVDNPEKYNITKPKDLRTITIILRKNSSAVHRFIDTSSLGVILNGTYTIEFLEVKENSAIVEVTVDIFVKWHPTTAKRLGTNSSHIKKSVKVILNLNTREVKLLNGTYLGVVPWWITKTTSGKVRITQDANGIVKWYWNSPINTKFGRLNVWLVEVETINNDYFRVPRGQRIGKYLYEVNSGILVSVLYGLYLDPVLTYLINANALGMVVMGKIGAGTVELIELKGIKFTNSYSPNVAEALMIITILLSTVAIVKKYKLLNH